MSISRLCLYNIHENLTNSNILQASNKHNQILTERGIVKKQSKNKGCDFGFSNAPHHDYFHLRKYIEPVAP